MWPITSTLRTLHAAFLLRISSEEESHNVSVSDKKRAMSPSTNGTIVAMCDIDIGMGMEEETRNVTDDDMSINSVATSTVVVPTKRKEPDSGTKKRGPPSPT